MERIVEPGSIRSAGREMEQASDEELVERFQKGEQAVSEELFRRYQGRIARLCAPLFLVGGDREDLIQEGRVGLYRAMTDYRAGEGTRFSTFADLCVTRAQLDAIEADGRKKHRPQQMQGLSVLT